MRQRQSKNSRRKVSPQAPGRESAGLWRSQEVCCLRVLPSLCYDSGSAGGAGVGGRGQKSHMPS